MRKEKNFDALAENSEIGKKRRKRDYKKILLWIVILSLCFIAIVFADFIYGIQAEKQSKMKREQAWDNIILVNMIPTMKDEEFRSYENTEK